MLHPTPIQVFYLELVFICSLLHTFLPPWDADVFVPFPKFVKFYKVIIYLVGYIAINGRSTVYPSISTKTTGGVNESITHFEKGDDAPKP